MKKDRILKTLAVLGAASTFAFGGLCACADNQKPTESPTEPNPPIVNPDDPKPDDPNPDDPKPTEKTDEEIFAEKVAEAETFFHAIDKNVTIDYTFEWGGSTFVSTVVYDDNKSKVVEGSDVTYYEQDGDQKYSYSNENGQWTKDFCEEDFYSFLNHYIEYFDRVEWTTYDKGNNQLVSKNNDTVKLSDGKTTILLSNVNDGVLKGDFSKVGTSSVELPREFVDNTQAQEENIYEIVDGQYKFDLVAIRDVLEPWLKNEGEGNQFGKDAFAAANVDETCTTKKVLFVNASKEKIEFGALLDKAGTPYFNIFWLDRAAMYEDIANGVCQTKTQFRDHLMKVLKTRIKPDTLQDIKLEYTTFDDDYAQNHKTEFEAMTNNIENKLGINMDEIYFAFKTAKGDLFAAGDNGYQVGWDQYYLANINGEIKLINTHIVSSTNRGSMNEIANVVDNTNYWNCSLQDEKVLNVDNSKIYEQTQTKNIEKSMEL